MCSVFAAFILRLLSFSISGSLSSASSVPPIGRMPSLAPITISTLFRLSLVLCIVPITTQSVLEGTRPISISSSPSVTSFFSWLLLSFLSPAISTIWSNIRQMAFQLCPVSDEASSSPASSCLSISFSSRSSIPNCDTRYE